VSTILPVFVEYHTYYFSTRFSQSGPEAGTPNLIKPASAVRELAGAQSTHSIKPHSPTYQSGPENRPNILSCSISI